MRRPSAGGKKSADLPSSRQASSRNNKTPDSDRKGKKKATKKVTKKSASPRDIMEGIVEGEVASTMSTEAIIFLNEAVGPMRTPRSSEDSPKSADAPAVATALATAPASPPPPPARAPPALDKSVMMCTNCAFKHYAYCDSCPRCGVTTAPAIATTVAVAVEQAVVTATSAATPTPTPTTMAMPTTIEEAAKQVQLLFMSNFMAVASTPAAAPRRPDPALEAQRCVATAMALNRCLVTANERVKTFNFDLDQLVGFDMQNVTIGVVGEGEAAKHCAKLMGAFTIPFGGKVLCTADGVGGEKTTAEDLHAKADILAFHGDSAAVDASVIGALKPTAMVLVSAAACDMGALVTALEQKKIG